MIKWIWTLALIGLVYADNVVKSEVKAESNAISLNSTTENGKSEILDSDKKKSAIPVLSTSPVVAKSTETVHEPVDNMPGSAINPIHPEKYISPIDENGLFLKYNYVFLTIVSLSMVAFIVVKTHR